MATQFLKDIKRVLNDIHEVSSILYMSLRQDIERGTVNISITHKIARMILEKDQIYSSHVTKSESQLFYSGFQVNTEERGKKVEEKTIRKKERNTS